MFSVILSCCRTLNLPPPPHAATLPCPAARHPPTRTAEDAERSLVPVSDRVADLLKPTGVVPRYGDHGYEGDIEMWQPCHVTIADKLDLERQLAAVDGALEPGNPGTVLARIHTLLAMYRDRDSLPTQVEAAIGVRLNKRRKSPTGLRF